MDELDGIPIVEVSMGSDYREMMEAMGGQVIPLGRGEGSIDLLAPAGSATAHRSRREGRRT